MEQWPSDSSRYTPRKEARGLLSSSGKAHIFSESKPNLPGFKILTHGGSTGDLRDGNQVCSTHSPAFVSTDRSAHRRLPKTTALLTTGNLIRWVSDRPFVLLFRCHGTLIVPCEMIDHIMSTPGEFATYDLLQPDVVSSPILIPRLHLLRLLPPGRLFPCPRSPGQVGTTVKSEV